MEITVYLHRTKKKKYEVCEKFGVVLNLDKLPEDKKTDIDFINRGFQNDAKRYASRTESIKKYGTGYVSYMIPKYEGPEDKNGNDLIYFDNKTMLFRLRSDMED